MRNGGGVSSCVTSAGRRLDLLPLLALPGEITRPRIVCPGRRVAMSNPERWHQIVVSDGAEFAAIGNRLDAALINNRKEGLERIAALREAGISGALESQETQIEVRDLRDALYLNDGALWLYRSLGGDKTVDETLNSLPNDCGSVIHNVWKEVRRP